MTGPHRATGQQPTPSRLADAPNSPPSHPSSADALDADRTGPSPDRDHAAVATSAGHPPTGPAPGSPEPLLPALTADESGIGWGDWREERDDDERLLREVPPHHGTY